MIKGQEIFKYIDPRAKYIVKDRSEFVYWCDEDPCIGKVVWALNVLSGCLGKIQIEEFEGKDWNECILKKEEDPKEWIGFLCWFWCRDSSKNISILKSITSNQSYPYLSTGNVQYKCCRPVKKSEIKLFEEK